MIINRYIILLSRKSNFYTEVYFKEKNQLIIISIVELYFTVDIVEFVITYNKQRQGQTREIYILSSTSIIYRKLRREIRN